MSGVDVVLAHGSGVDDVLWFAVPVVAAITLLRLAERRARRNARRADERSPGRVDADVGEDGDTP